MEITSLTSYSSLSSFVFRSQNENSYPIENVSFLIGFNKRLYRFEMKTLYMNTITLKSSVKNLVAPYEYVNIMHSNDGGYMKMETYLGIILLTATIYLRIRHP